MNGSRPLSLALVTQCGVQASRVTLCNGARRRPRRRSPGSATPATGAVPRGLALDLLTGLRLQPECGRLLAHGSILRCGRPAGCGRRSGTGGEVYRGAGCRFGLQAIEGRCHPTAFLAGVQGLRRRGGLRVRKMANWLDGRSWVHGQQPCATGRGAAGGRMRPAAPAPAAVRATLRGGYGIWVTTTRLPSCWIPQRIGQCRWLALSFQAFGCEEAARKPNQFLHAWQSPTGTDIQ